MNVRIVVGIFFVVATVRCEVVQERDAVFDLLSETAQHSIIYAPWRDSAYTPLTKGEITERKGCPFCKEIKAHNDEKYFVLGRFQHNFVTLNMFPYAKGHVLILPFAHVANLTDMGAQARAEMMELAAITLKILEDLYGVSAANVGINIGKLAGSSVPDHVHLHVIPRSFFVPSFPYAIGNTAVVTFDIKKVYEEMKQAFDKLPQRAALTQKTEQSNAE